MPVNSEPPEQAKLPELTPLEPVYLDGAWLPLATARVSPLDRGFLFGDAVYEVVKVRGGRLLFVGEHRVRLDRSLAALAIPTPAGLVSMLAELVRRTGLTSGSVYFQVTRGVGPRRAMPPADLLPTVFAMATPQIFTGPRREGWRAVSMIDPRWSRADVKTTALAGTMLGKLAASAAGADEVVFVSPDGTLREGGNVNLLVIRPTSPVPDSPTPPSAVLVTPPLGRELLAGITRDVLLAAARSRGVEVVEVAPNVADRASWSELLACGTLTGVQAIVELDGEPIGTGRPGPWANRMWEMLERAESAWLDEENER